MRVQFDRVLRYPKEVHDEDDKLAAAFFRPSRLRVSDVTPRVRKITVPPRLRQVTHFHSWIPRPESQSGEERYDGLSNVLPGASHTHV